MSRRVLEYYVDWSDLGVGATEFPRGLRHEPVERREAAAREATSADASSAPAAVGAMASTAGERSCVGVDEQSPAGLAAVAGDRTRNLDVIERPSPAVAKEQVVGWTTDSGSPAQGTRVRRLLSVHALGQVEYCLRSAILAEEQGDERDVDEGLPRLTYLPNFDREQIEEALAAKITQLGFFALYGACLVVLMKMGVDRQNRWVFYPSLTALAGLVVWSLGVVVAVFELAARRRAALRAAAREPAPTISSISRVNWWSLLKAGFEPILCNQPFQHPDLPLEGRPWRVLQRGSLRIPVIRSGSHELGPGRDELYPKHAVRLAAYALLLETIGGVEVPYGVVVPVDSPRGLALPITAELRARAVQDLHELERRLDASQRSHFQPTPPEHRERCARCEYGRPAPTTARQAAQLRKSGERLLLLRDRGDSFYRCECGDRFGSAPPHRLTLQKGLTAVVE